ncbi:MAG: hypothetical protein Kow0049_16510 [Stanieria sp.]
MNAGIKTFNKKKKNNYLKTTPIILIAFTSAFFPRIIESAGIPSIINFVHFALVPFVWVVSLFTTRSKNQKQLYIVKEFLYGLFLLLSVGCISAFWNRAGVINLVLSFLLLAEPFFLLIAIIIIPMSLKSLKQFQGWMTGFLFFHLLLIYIQYGQGFCHLPGDCDNIQGVFYRSGSGHVVGASVSCSFGLYYLLAAKNRPFWLRALVFVASFLNIQLADAKQVLVMFIGAWAIMILIQAKNIRQTFVYITSLATFLVAFIWAVQNIEALGSFATWARPELYGPNGEATLLKFSGIRYILSYFSSPINWLVGLGPGHTISRMGGWMIRDYSHIIGPLGATNVPEGKSFAISYLVWNYVAQSWLAEGSSFFAPFWGWAGIWGDFGFLGLGTYLYLCSIVWRKICLDNLSKFLMLTVAICGFIFTQMEEPGYMLYIAALLGLRWQERNISKNVKQNCNI